ncbi:ornithine cyclodeaminase/alanine dehydrogenase-like protein (mu-crystallin family) [Mesorhizobium soli]|uniref:ornithine cyclodeaminase family protein n=1 Tax=Pseudaminobacter soli (ex Li et al. 2025) TaxID=1295366 RepID=UPI002475A67A|nr:ornithine cyclodeaminase family protein [Mesorhizobium soli]MDH6233792.1 ornithine cyclodeaminase/alanine dehydrogenase-like protein (mu-crystallin family) [Mesorhizobium soli]
MGGLVILDAAQTTRQLPFDGLVEALRHGFIEGCQLPERHHHTLTREGELDATLLLMPAWTDPGKGRSYLGVKLVTVVPGNAARELPGLVSTYILFDGLTGEQLALMDGNTITGRRTAATSALAASYLSRPDSSKLLVLGAGRVGSLIPEAYQAVRPIETVAVWDINPDAARRLTDQLVNQGFRASVADDLERAVKSADIVSTATLATTPIVRGAWLQPGTHVDLIGAFTPQMREADDDVIRRASLYIDTTEAFHEAGDIVQPIEHGIISKETVRGTLAQLCKTSQPARGSDDEITCFKAVGSGLADLVSAKMVYRRLR